METLALLSNSPVCLDLLTGLVRLKCHRTVHVDASKISHGPPSPCISNHTYFQRGQDLSFSQQRAVLSSSLCSADTSKPGHPVQAFSENLM